MKIEMKYRITLFSIPLVLQNSSRIYNFDAQDYRQYKLKLQIFRLI